MFRFLDSTQDADFILGFSTQVALIRLQPPPEPTPTRRFIRSPKPPYPPQALQMHLTGNVILSISILNGQISDVKLVSGPAILTNAAVRWVKNNWQAAPTVNGTFTIPFTFQIAH